MTIDRWDSALQALSPLGRHHAGPEMDHAYDVLVEHYPDCEILGYPSGEKCGYWTSPMGWVVNSGKLIDPNGDVVVDYLDHPIHLFSYSPSFSGIVQLDELQSHLFSNPDNPDAIPFHFRNQYRPWDTQWGFCLSHNERSNLPEGEYTIEIDTNLIDSEMKLALQTHSGESSNSLLLVGHFDHPGQAGDGLIGCLAAHEAIERLRGKDTKITYRALSTVEIVGSVFYAENRRADNVQQALFCAMSGVNAPLIYARSSSSDCYLDNVVEHLLVHHHEQSSVVNFRQSTGNDEIAFDHIGVKIPCGSLLRSPHENYHTHFDTAESMSKDHMENFISLILDTINIFEKNAVLNGTFDVLPMLSHPDLDLYLQPNFLSGMKSGSDQLADRILSEYSSPSKVEAAQKCSNSFNKLMTLLPALCDGTTTVLDLAGRTGVPFEFVDAYTDLWVEKGLLVKTWVDPFEKKGSPK